MNQARKERAKALRAALNRHFKKDAQRMANNAFTEPIKTTKHKT